MFVSGAVSALDETSLLVIVTAAAVASVLTLLIAPRLVIPVVVLELVLGILIGPEVLDLAQVDATTKLFGDLGLGMLFFFAGYEIDFERIRGKPLKLGGIGWLLSLVLAYGIGGGLAAAGVVVSYLYTGSAMATTAIGTLIPILRDDKDIHTRFGKYLLGAGAVGEFGPILLVTLSSRPATRSMRRSSSSSSSRSPSSPASSPSAEPPWAGRWSSGRSSRAASSRCGSRSCSSSGWSRWRPSSASTCCSAASWPA